MATSQFKQAELDLRTSEMRLRVTAEQATAFEKRRTEAVNKRKADEVGRVMAMNEVAELMPRVERAEELAEAASRVALTAGEAEAAAKESLDTARMRARMGPEALVASLEEGALEAQEMMEGVRLAACCSLLAPCRLLRVLCVTCKLRAHAQLAAVRMGWSWWMRRRRRRSVSRWARRRRCVWAG